MKILIKAICAVIGTLTVAIGSGLFLLRKRPVR